MVSERDNKIASLYLAVALPFPSQNVSRSCAPHFVRRKRISATIGQITFPPNDVWASGILRPGCILMVAKQLRVGEKRPSRPSRTRMYRGAPSSEPMAELARKARVRSRRHKRGQYRWMPRRESARRGDWPRVAVPDLRLLYIPDYQAWKTGYRRNVACRSDVGVDLVKNRAVPTAGPPAICDRLMPTRGMQRSRGLGVD